MAKQLNVNVAVTADTSAAKAQLQQLQASLQQLSTSSTNLHLGLNTSELNKAIADVDKLQAHLKNATNSSGMLDFSKLNNSIKASGSSLTEYGNQLLKLGPQGQQAFNQLTQAVAKSTVPMSRMKGILGEFGTVLGNTIKWQAASSAIHGMMGSIQHAFSYAEQLNKSLNNIQIVTQNSDSQMARFADSANKAAKQLNTTTTAYTNASLIYYQQGLSDKEVAARTETTIKMANASGQSAEKVSDQMTAIWNNFAKGGENLEHYADVITALGAATASSSSEIATGLQKFASVADTVGLSYENATAALATITATTRQSADSVGTGLRTLFARLQSLNLGETLDDGVTLSKYSKALDTIGVKVLDYSGNLRSADDILEDMGAKWQELSSAQKTAVAQTVGGVRQYTTIMALMDNFDFYKQNQKIAANADGTVQAQADIYAKSWEAAQKRVKASAESIYSDLINDDFFISLNDGLAGFLNLLDQIIDGMGGLKTLLPMIGAAMTAAFSDKATLGLVNLSNNLKMLTPGAAKRDRTERDAFLDQALKVQTGYDSKNYKNLSVDQKLQYDYAKRDLEFQRAYANNSRYMTGLDQMIAQSAMDKYSNLRNAYMQNSQQLAASRYNKVEAQSNMIGANGTNFNIYTKKNQMGEAGKAQLKQAKQFYSLAQSGPSEDGPKYFTDSLQDPESWFAHNGQFLKSNYDLALQNSGDVKTLTKDLSRLDHQARFLKEWEQAGDQGSKAALGKLKTSGFDMSRVSNFYDKDTGKITNFDAMRQEIGALTAEQDKMVTDFAAKWGKSKEAVMQYKDAIVATNGNINKQKELKQQMDQADEEAAKATKKNQQVQRAQNVVKYAQAMQGAVAAGQSFAAVTQNISNNLENGGSIFDNFGATLSGATSGLMSMAMTMAAIPGPAGIALAAISAIIGVASQIPGVQKFFHELFHSEDELALERMQKASEDVGNSLEDTKKKAEEFLEATGTHNGLLDKIKECTRGTNEFKAAVAEANAYAKQMINDFNLSLSDFTVDSNGAFVLDEQVAEAKKTEYENQIQNLEAAQNYLDNYVIPQQESKMARDKINKLGKEELHTSNEYGASKGAMGLWFTGENEEGFWGYDPTRGTTLGELLDNYIEHGLEVGANSFQEYVDGYTGGNGSQTAKFDNFVKQIEEATGQTVDEYVANQREYGTQEAQRLAQDKVLKGYFDQEVINRVFNDQDLDKNIASFVGQNMSNGNNYSKLGFNQAVKDRAVITDANRESIIAALAKEYNQDPDVLRKDTELLQALAEAYHAKRLTDEEFQKEYGQVETADKKIRAKVVASTKNKDKDQIGNLKQTEQDDLRAWLEQQVKENAEINPLLSDYYQSVIDNYDKVKQMQIDGLAEVLSRPDELSKEGNKAIQEYLTNFIGNLNIDDQTLNEVTNLMSQINNAFSSEKSPLNMKQLFESLFDGNEIDEAMLQAWRQIDFSNRVSALFDIKDLSNSLSDKDLRAYFNDLYDTVLKSFDSKSDILADIFGTEGFQKELKKVQKEFKRTGRIGVDELEDLIDSSEDLSRALESGLFTSGGLSAAIQLYSSGAIQDISEISDTLWAAIEAASELTTMIQQSFDYIDNWNPSRSSQDIVDFFSKIYKDFQDQIEHGRTGDERTYEDANMLWNDFYANVLKDYYHELETTVTDDQDARIKEMEEFMGWINEASAEMVKKESFNPMWDLFLSSDPDKIAQFFGNGTIGSGNPQEYGIQEGLKAMGFDMGEDHADLEVDFAELQNYLKANHYESSTSGAQQALADLLGIDFEKAGTLLTGTLGASRGLTDLFAAQDYINGLEMLQNSGEREQLLFAQTQGAYNENLALETLGQQIIGIIKQNGYETPLNEAGDIDLTALRETTSDAELSKAIDLYALLTKISEERQVYENSEKDFFKWLNGTQDVRIDNGNKYLDLLKEEARVIDDISSEDSEIGEAIDIDKATDLLSSKGITDPTKQWKAIQEMADQTGGRVAKTWTDISGQVHHTAVNIRGSLDDTMQALDDATQAEQRMVQKTLGEDIGEGIFGYLNQLIADGNIEALAEQAGPISDLFSALASLNADSSAQSLETVREKIAAIKESFSGTDEASTGFLETLNKLDNILSGAQQGKITFQGFVGADGKAVDWESYGKQLEEIGSLSVKLDETSQAQLNTDIEALRTQLSNQSPIQIHIEYVEDNAPPQIGEEENDTSSSISPTTIEDSDYNEGWLEIPEKKPETPSKQKEIITPQQALEMFAGYGISAVEKNLLENGISYKDMFREDLATMAMKDQYTALGGKFDTTMSNSDMYNSLIQMAAEAVAKAQGYDIEKQIPESVTVEADNVEVSTEQTPEKETDNKLTRSSEQLKPWEKGTSQFMGAYNRRDKSEVLPEDISVGIADNQIGQVTTDTEQLSTSLEAINEQSSIPVDINVTTSMEPSEIEHLSDDFEDMVTYSNIHIDIQLDPSQVLQVKELKDEFNQLKDILTQLGGVDLSGITDGLDSGNTPKGKNNTGYSSTGTYHNGVPIEVEQPTETQQPIVSTQTNMPTVEPTIQGSADEDLQYKNDFLETYAKNAAEAAEKLNLLQKATQGTAKAVDQNADAAENASEAIEEVGEKVEDTTDQMQDYASSTESAASNQENMAQTGQTIVEQPEIELDNEQITESLNEMTEVSNEPIEVETTDNGTTEEVQEKLESVEAMSPINVSVNVSDHGSTNQIIGELSSVPTSISTTVNVSVVGSNAFGSTVTFAAGGAVGLGAWIEESAIDYATEHPKMKQFIEETRNHYAKKAGGGGYGSKAFGGNIYNSYINGSANRYARPGISLVAEEGPEIVWNKMAGYSYITGGHGHPEFVELQPGDRVFNANDTRKILNYNRPKSNEYSVVKNPNDMADGLFQSHAGGLLSLSLSLMSSNPPSTTASVNSSGSTGSRGGGGGGGGGGSDEDNWQLYNPERYHYMIRQIDRLTSEYEDLEKARERAYGVNVSAAIDKEITGTQKLIGKNREYLDILKDQLKTDEKDLKSLAGVDIKLDENGDIINYDELRDKYFELAETGSVKDDGEAYKTAKRVKQAIENYEDTLDKIKETRSTLMDELYQLNDLRLEKITQEIEMKVTVNDRELDVLEHYLTKLEDNAHGTAAAIQIVGQKLGVVASTVDTTTQGIKDLFAQMNGEAGNRVLVKRDKNSASGYVENENGEVKTDWNEEWHNYYLKNYEDKEVKKAYDKAVKKGYSKSYEEYLEEQFMSDKHLKQLSAEEFIAGVQKGINFHIDSKWGEALEDQVDDLLKAIEDMEEYRTYAAERLTKDYETLAEDVERQVSLFDHYASTLDNLKSITELQGITMPESIKKITDGLNRAMIDVTKNNIVASKDQLASLTTTANQIRALMAQTTDEATRKIYEDELNSIEDQINEVEEGILSAWADGLQKAKDLFQTAMDEAVKAYDNALSSMYGTTSLLSDAIDRRQNIADQYVDDYEKFYQLTKLERTINKDIDDRVNKGVKNNQRLQAILQEINNIRATGQKVSETELDLLQKRYDIAKAQADLEDAREAKSVVRLQRDRNGNWGYVYTNVEDTAEEELQQKVDDSIYEYQKALTESMNELASSVQDLVQQRNEKITSLYQQYVNGEITKDVLDANLADIEAWFESQSAYFQEQFTKFSGWATDTVDIAKQLYNTSAFNILDAFGETVVGAVNNVSNIGAIIAQSNDATNTYLNTMADQVSIYEQQVADLNHTVNNSINTMDDYTKFVEGWSNQVVGESAATTSAVQSLTAALDEQVQKSAEQAWAFENLFSKGKNGYDNLITRAETFLNTTVATINAMNGVTDSLTRLGEAQKHVNDATSQENPSAGVTPTSPIEGGVASFDIGGYTGSWGPEGRLAFLHEQEAIFDKQDTRNLLTAANILRTIDLQAQAFSQGFGALQAAMGGSNSGTTIEQQVTIEASFPNATNHSEIEEAFNNLVNKATQYANRGSSTVVA